MRHYLLLAAVATSLALPACQEQGLTRAEASTAVSEAALEGEAASVVSTPIEISTNFTIGKALKDAATELKSFIAAQLPCAQVTVVDNTITTVWGTTAGCSYKGVTLTGTSQVTISRNEDGSVQVDHKWTDMSNGRVKVNGTANVTWSRAESSRHVVHDLTWTRLSDGRTGHGTGDRTQRLLDPSKGLAGGIGIDGNRAWETNKGKWNLAITGVELRLTDPVPYDGKYTLTNPAGKMLTVEFTRKSETEITVEVASGTTRFTFVVRSTGAIADA
jgi:hypothetical protein